jgi:hypothetical protein
LDDAVHDLLGKQRTGELLDVLAESLSCDACSARIEPSALPQDVVAVTSHYLNFCHLESSSLSAAAMASLEAAVGCRLRCIAERL